MSLLFLLPPYVRNLALSTPTADQRLALDELGNRISQDKYYGSFINKYQPRYNKTEIARMLGYQSQEAADERQQLYSSAPNQ